MADVTRNAELIAAHPHSGKFYRKVHFIRSLAQLPLPVALEPQLVPAPVQRVDAALQPRPQQPQQRYQPAQD